MATAHELRAYDYVNRPYSTVRAALASDRSVFRRATNAAASRADALAASLRVDLGGVEVGTGIDIVLESVEENDRRTVLRIGWEASRAAALFPAMKATLSVYALSPTETQLDLHGTYTPPLGLVGAALDSLALHRVAEASVHRFVTDIARLLRAELPER